MLDKSVLNGDEQAIYQAALEEANKMWKAEDGFLYGSGGDDVALNSSVSSTIQAELTRDVLVGHLQEVLEQRGFIVTEDDIQHALEVDAEAARNKCIVDEIFADVSDDMVMDEGVTGKQAKEMTLQGLNRQAEREGLGHK